MTDTRYIPPPTSDSAHLVHGGNIRSVDLFKLITNRSTDPIPLLNRYFTFKNYDMRLVDSGTSALALALTAAGIGNDNEVIVSSFNCPQVIEAILAVGAVPVICDIDQNYGVPSINKVNTALSSKSAAVIITHQFGIVEPVSIELAEWAKHKGLAVIDDAAQAIGASCNGGFAGTLGDYGVFSFGPSKPINAGGGGALIGGNNSIHIKHSRFFDGYIRQCIKSSKLEALSNKNSSRAMHSDVKVALESKIINPIIPRDMPGWNKQLLFKTMLTIEETIEKRKANLYLLNELVASTPIRLILDENHSGNNAYAWFIIPDGLRYEIGLHLSLNGFQCSWYHYPLHRLSKYGMYAKQQYTQTDYLWPALLQVPCRYLSPDKIHTIAKLIKERI